MEQYNPLDYGIVVLALMLIWKMLEIAKTMFLVKRAEVAGVPYCVKDPLHGSRVQKIHQLALEVEKQTAEGKFECHWKDRDEVRDFMEAIRDQTKATTALTMELRLTRNGKKL